MSAITRERGYVAPSGETNIRRQKLIQDLGYQQLASFEYWAFNSKKPITYDNRIIFLWQCAHSTKYELKEDDLDEALAAMINLWKGRFNAGVS